MSILDVLDVVLNIPDFLNDILKISGIFGFSAFHVHVAFSFPQILIPHECHHISKLLFWQVHISDLLWDPVIHLLSQRTCTNGRDVRT